MTTILILALIAVVGFFIAYSFEDCWDRPQPGYPRSSFLSYVKVRQRPRRHK